MKIKQINYESFDETIKELNDNDNNENIKRQ